MYRRVEDKEIISQAEQEANAIRERAAIEGFEQGVHQATQQLEALRGLLIQLLEGKQSALQSLESDIVPIAVAVAEKILQREALCDTELVTGLVKQTIMRVDKDVKRIMVKVHPDEVATVKAFLDPNPFPDVDAQLLVLEDALVDRGSCTVETASGLVDASFSTQLAIVRRVLGVQESTDHATDSSPDTLLPSHEPPHGD
jgi:flagellar assembly protein FliH